MKFQNYRALGIDHKGILVKEFLIGSKNLGLFNALCCECFITNIRGPDSLFRNLFTEPRFTIFNRVLDVTLVNFIDRGGRVDIERDIISCISDHDIVKPDETPFVFISERVYVVKSVVPFCDSVVDHLCMIYVSFL